MKPLKVFAVGAEMTVIATLAASSYHVAFSGASSMSDWLAGAPILTVVALETLRLPIAFNMAKSRLPGFLLSVVLIGGLSVITGEAASLAFENLIFQRTRSVVEAERDLAKVNISRHTLDEVNGRRTEEIDRLTAGLAAAREHRAEIDKPVVMQPIAGDVTKYRKVGKKWQPYNANAGIQSVTANADAAAQAAHSAELRNASDQVARAEERLAAAGANPPDMHVSDDAVATAKQRVTDARSMNPMFRVASAWQNVPVEDLSSEQFEQVKHWAVIALATATALTTAMAAIISSLPERGETNGKLARAMRSMFLARRKTLRRFNERVVTEFKERTKLVYVPVDVATGKVLDPAFQPAPSSTPNLKVVVT
jgi:hypothetical protein